MRLKDIQNQTHIGLELKIATSIIFALGKGMFINLNYGVLIEEQDKRTKTSDIEAKTSDIEAKTSDIEEYIGRISGNILSREKAEIVFNEFKNGGIFGRNEIMDILNVKRSTASELLKKMLEADIVIVVKGAGKGKYRVNRELQSKF